MAVGASFRGRFSRRTAHGLLLDTGPELPVSRTYQQEIAKQFVAFLQ